MAKAIVDYGKGRREFLLSLYEKKILGLESTIENKEIAIFVAALGCKDHLTF